MIFKLLTLIIMGTVLAIEASRYQLCPFGKSIYYLRLSLTLIPISTDP